MTTALRPLDGYPDSFGSHRASVFPHAGPSSYTQYTAPTTGGDQFLLPPEAGVKTAEKVLGGVSRSGLYRAEAVQLTSASYNGVTLGNVKVILKWYVVSTGSEVAGAVDLSGVIVDLMVFGPKS